MSEQEAVVGAEIDAALRALAEAANCPMTCGGHQSMGSLIRCEECTARHNARRDLSAACSPDVVLSLLDRANGRPMPATQPRPNPSAEEASE